jgi:hypothetical protein
MLLAWAGCAPTWATVYSSRDAFLAALSPLGLAVGSETYESRAPGAIANGQSLGSFSYAFDAALTQPAVASDDSGGQALGGAPFGVFVGGDAVTLHFTGSQPLRAFGADYFFAPSFLPAPATIYRMAILDGLAAGTTAANGPDLDPAGGSFFLGFIEDAASAFNDLSLFSVVPADASGEPFFLVAAYQIDNLVFAANDLPGTSVPEPATLPLFALGGLLLIRRLPRRALPR